MAAERKYVIEHVNHQPVESIAKALARSVKSVRRKIEDMGLSGRSEEDYSVKLAMDLHVRPSDDPQLDQREAAQAGTPGRIKEH